MEGRERLGYTEHSHTDARK